ncbi:MAG: AzlD domain-containing protein [archaeon]|nr:AzlD domain-containing protein [archaeon]
MMSPVEQILVIVICGIVTLLTRFLPFVVFGREGEVSPRVSYLGRALPAALFAMLVVYCLKDVDFLGGVHGLPEIVSIAFIVVVHLKWRNMLLSLVGGVAFYLVVGQLLTLLP